MDRWTPLPAKAVFTFERKSLRRYWPLLHAGDGEAYQQDAALLDAWVDYHNGAFQSAFEAAVSLDDAGATLANRASCTYATYLETDPARRLDFYLQAASRAAAHVERHPDNANAHFLHAFALGRYSQGISVTRALALGFGSDVKRALHTALKLQPQHVESHIALGAFHAEVINKVGALIGNLTYGAKREDSLVLFERGLTLQPRSPSALTEYALALLMLDGETRSPQAQSLFAKAAAMQPVDAPDFLAIAVAQAGLPPENAQPYTISIPH